MQVVERRDQCQAQINTFPQWEPQMLFQILGEVSWQIALGFNMLASRSDLNAGSRAPRPVPSPDQHIPPMGAADAFSNPWRGFVANSPWVQHAGLAFRSECR